MKKPNRMFHQVCAGALSLVLLLGMMPSGAYAAPEESQQEGAAEQVVGAQLPAADAQAPAPEASDAAGEGISQTDRSLAAPDANALKVDARSPEGRETDSAAAEGADADASSLGLKNQLIVTYDEAVQSTEEVNGFLRPLSSADGSFAEDSELLADGIGESGTEAIALVTLKDGVSVEDAIESVESEPGVICAEPNKLYYLLEDDPGDLLDDTMEALANESDLVDAADDLFAPETSGEGLEAFGVVPQATVNDPLASQQWWLKSPNLFGAWDYVRTQGKVTVAVLDTTPHSTHPDLKDNLDMTHARSFIGTTSDSSVGERPIAKEPPNYLFAHGSLVAGAVSARADNGRGIAGASYNAKVLPLNVFTMHEGDSVTADSILIRAYQYLLSDPDGNGKSVAKELNVRVVNMSLGGYGEKGVALERVIDAAYSQGILSVAAGGNGEVVNGILQDTTAPSWPSDYDKVLSVVAIDSNNRHPDKFDHNQYKDIAAPGIDILTTSYRGEEYERADGTSLATPIVSGIAAMLFARHPSATPSEVRSAMTSSAIDLGAEGRDDYFGYGRVDARGAVGALDRIMHGKSVWKRLSGSTALDTMNAIVGNGTGFSAKGGTVVIATVDGYWDALSASGLAGLAKAPVLMTSGTSLSRQTKAQLQRLAPKNVVICGGTGSVSGTVESDIQKACGVKPVRCAGASATGTACDIFRKAPGITGAKWSDTAFIATNDGYWDALAIAPYAYAKRCPIFLSEGSKSLSSETIRTMVSGGIKNVYLVGGTGTLSDSVKTQLAKAGLTVRGRLQGQTAIETSQAVAEFALKNGMSAKMAGVATVNGYWDALSGAALCGKNNAPLLLVSDEQSSTIAKFVQPRAGTIKTGFVFGGEGTVSNAVLDRLRATVK